jgi:PAS domain S-box-containing protein
MHDSDKTAANGDGWSFRSDFEILKKRCLAADASLAGELDRLEEHLAGASARSKDHLSQTVKERDLVIESLRESEALQRQLLASLPVAVMIVDPVSRAIEHVNDHVVTLFGDSMEHLIGRRCHSFICPADEGACPVCDLGKEVDNSERVMLRADGGSLPVLKTVKRIRMNGREKLLECFVDISERKRVAETLQSKTALLEAQANATIDGILVVDENKKRVFTNRRIIELFNVPRHIADDEDDAALLRHVVSQTKNPEAFLEKVLYLYDHVKETSRDEVEFKNGMVLDRYSSPVLGKGGEYFGRIWAFRDITEWKRAQQKVKESEENYRLLVENAGVIVVRWDLDGRLLFTNAIGARYFGKEPDELVGRHVTEVFGPTVGGIYLADMRKLIETGVDTEHESQLHLPDGSRWFWTRRSILKNHQGMATGIVSFAREITEQKLAQIALRESEDRRRMLTEMAMEGIFMHEDGVLLEANPRYFEMFGYMPEELIGRQARDITLTPESLYAVTENMRAGGDKRIQITGVRKDGSQFPCEIYGLDAVYRGRNVRVAMAMDISDRVKTETELAQMQEKMAVTERLAAVGYMGATMAHEINTPLSVMKLTAQMLIGDLDKNKVSAANKGQAQTILNEIDHAGEIVRRYREMSRPARDVSHNASDIRSALDGVINLLRKTADRAKLQLLMGPEVPELLTRLGSVDRAEQVLLILVENAIQATDGKTWRELNIAGSLKDGCVEIRFVDNCCGIPPENLQKIFEPFFSTKPRNVGTGLGLSIVRRLLQERGGRIQVESQVGKGSVFVVTYPF